jgi:integrase
MARTPKPWFREDRQSWFVTIDGKRQNLGPDKTKAHQKFHELMSKPVQKRVVLPASVAVLVDQFLEWVQQHRAPDTYVWYQTRLQLFVRKWPDLLITELRPFHVQQWIDGYKVASGTKRNFARSIMRCMTWCEEQGLIDRSPIRFFKKPRGGKREQVISPAEYKAILGCFKRPFMRDLLTFAWETGARAAEILDIEDRHCDLINQRIIFPVDEEKMERAPRVIYLTETAERIIRRLMRQGKLFRNSDGLPWTTDAVNCLCPPRPC